MDVDAALLTFVLEPTSGDFARVLFGVERFLVGRLDSGFSTLSPGQIIFVTPWVHRSACERMRAIATHIEPGHILDIFNVEGMLLEHSDCHRVGIVGGLSCQVPSVLCRLVHANTQLEMFFFILSWLSRLVLGTSRHCSLHRSCHSTCPEQRSSSSSAAIRVGILCRVVLLVSGR